MQLHNVPRVAFIYIGLSKDQLHASRDAALLELLRNLLYFDFLRGHEARVLGEEGEFAADFVFLALLGLASLHRRELIIQNFHVVFAAADVAGEGADRQPRLDLICLYDDAFDHHQGADHA